MVTQTVFQTTRIFQFSDTEMVINTRKRDRMEVFELHKLLVSRSC